MATIRLQAPNGFAGAITGGDNAVIPLAADGTVTVDGSKPTTDPAALLRAGFRPVAHDSGATGQRPSPCAVGTCFFDTSVGKPVFRGVAGWVDATGTAV